MSDSCPVDIKSDEIIFAEKWVGVRQVSFINPKTRESGIWQIPYRTSTPKTAQVDGVSVIAILIKTAADGRKEKSFVFVKQYRIPPMAYSLEFPAGLLDASETALEAGLRELKEETGFTASKVLSCTKGVQTLDPGFSNDSLNFVIVEIDGDSSENANPKQKLDHGEDIEVVIVPCNRVMEAFAEFTRDGVSVEAMVYSFAIGYSMGQPSL